MPDTHPHRIWPYCLVIGLAGYGTLAYATLISFDTLPGALGWIPFLGYLVAFTGLSVVVKRFGFHVAPEARHSLVGVVDVAAIIILGPVPGAWVASVSGLVYLVLRAVRHRQTAPTDLVAVPLFNSGLKALMALSSGALYLATGGQLAFATLTPALLLPLALLMVTWFALDHLGWAGLTLVAGGRQTLLKFLRGIITTSLLVEFLPLPFSLLIVGAYTQGPLTLALIALAVIVVGYVLQHMFHVRQRLQTRVAELTTFDDLGRSIVQAQLDVDGLCELTYEQASRILDTTNFMLGLIDADGEHFIAQVWVEEGVRRPRVVLPLSEGMVWMAEHKRPLLIHDSRREELPFTPQTTDVVTLAALFVPLMVGPNFIGSISVRSRRPNAFTEEQLRTLSVIAHQIAVAIENARLYQLASERVRELTNLNEIGRAITSSLDPKEILTQIMERAVQLLNSEAGSLLLQDERTGELVFRIVLGAKGAAVRGVRLQPDQGIAGAVFTSGEPLIVNQAHTDPRIYRLDDRTGFITRNLLAVPLVGKAGTIGVIEVINRRDEQPYEWRDRERLMLLASQAAIAIENARLFESERHRRQVADVMRQVAETVGSTLDLDQVLNRLLEQLDLVVDYDIAAILLLRGDRLHVTAEKGFPDPARALAATFALEDSPRLRRLVDERRPIVFRDAHEPDPFEELAGVKPAHSCLGAPLLVQDQLLGVLTIDKCELDRYDQETADLVAAFARQAAIAIDNAQLYQAQRQRAEQLSLLNQVSRRIAAILDLDELLRQVVRLVRETFGYYYVAIGLVEDDWVVFAYGAIDRDQIPRANTPSPPIRLPIDGPGLTTWAAREGQAVYVPDVSTESRYLLMSHLPEVRSELTVPLRAGDRMVGVLDVASDRLDAFDAHDQTLLESLADQIAIAVENARLVQEQQEEAWVTTALFQVGASLSNLTRLEDILDTVVRLTPILVGVDRCLVFLWDHEEETYTAAAAFGLSDSAQADFDRLRLRPGEILLLDEARLSKRIQKVSDVPGDGRLPASWITAWELDAVLALPLISKNEVLGVMLVDFNPQAQQSPARAEAIVAGMANQAAIAIESAQLYEALQEEAWISTAMLQVAEAVGRLTNLDEVLSTVARITPLLVGVDRCSILLWDEGSQVFYPSQVYGLPRSMLDAFMALRFSPAEMPALEAMRRDPRPAVMNEPRRDELLPPELVEAFGVKGLLALPLVARGEVMGLMVVDYAAESTRFTSRRIDVAQGIANQAAIAVETAQLYREMAAKERLERELEVARQIQASFLPDSCPAIPGWQVAADWRSARQVGGDFYDFIELPGGRWGLVIADVSDKGVPAALFMALSRTLIRATASEDRGPADVLSHANALMLADTRSELFVTAFYAVLDTRRHVLTYASAGHNPPLLVRARDGELLRLRADGIVLGIVEDVDLEERQVDLAEGDVLVLYTDGVTDAINSREEEFSEGRLREVVQQNAGLSVAGIAAAVNDAVADFVGDTPAFDDFTLVVLKYGGAAADVAGACKKVNPAITFLPDATAPACSR